MVEFRSLRSLRPLLLIAFFTFFLGGSGLALMLKDSSAALEKKQSRYLESLHLSNGLSAMGWDVDSCLTLGDLFVEGGVSYLGQISIDRVRELRKRAHAFEKHLDSSDLRKKITPSFRARLADFMTRLRCLQESFSQTLGYYEGHSGHDPQIQKYQELAGGVVVDFEFLSNQLKNKVVELASDTKRLQQEVSELFSIALFLTILAMLALVGWLFRHLVKPIEWLAQVESAEELESRFKGSHTKPYFRHLPNEIQTVAHNIHGLLQGLEQLVERRTRALRDKSQQLENQAVKLREARDRAETASAAKGLFLANLSHEIRTPLNGIIGLSDLLRQDVLDDEQLKAVTMIHTSGQHLLEMLSDVIDFAKQDYSHPNFKHKPTQLRELIETCYEISKNAYPHPEIVTQLSLARSVPDRAMVVARPMSQILLNLIGNALKFTERGLVTIEVQVSSVPASTDCLLVTVSDTGPGIERSDQERIFEPFIQVDGSLSRRHGGLGLGLGIARVLARSLQGDITVSSVPGKGSRFCFQMPLVLLQESKPYPRVSKNTAHATRHEHTP